MTHQPNNVSAAGVLLPCPFCGADQGSYETKDLESLDRSCGAWTMTCIACGCSTRGEKSPAEAIAAWNRRAAASAQATGQAVQGKRPDPTDIQGWSVTVNVNAQDILTIGHNSLSGIDNIEDFAQIVRDCAEHLVAFIGSEPAAAPSPAAREAGDGVTLTDEQRTTIQHAADKLRTVWANHTGDKESRELCHKLEDLLREAGSR